MIKTISLTLLLLPVLLSGCATPKYACGVPDGIGCKPLSEVHQMAKDGSLKMKAAPNNREDDSKSEKPAARADILRLAEEARSETSTDDEAEESVAPQRIMPNIVTVTPGAPILIPPRTMRVWVARWPDEDGTLHDETYLYLRLDNGRWLVE